jgi:hypothetical protein
LGIRGAVLSRVSQSGENAFRITSKGHIDSTDLEDHLIDLLELLEPIAKGLEVLRNEEGFEFEFFCYWESATGQGGPVVSSNTLGRMAQLHIDLDFDIYMSEGLFSDK